jgi:hypothetical protein
MQTKRSFWLSNSVDICSVGNATICQIICWAYPQVLSFIYKAGEKPVWALILFQQGYPCGYDLWLLKLTCLSETLSINKFILGIDSTIYTSSTYWCDCIVENNLYSYIWSGMCWQQLFFTLFTVKGPNVKHKVRLPRAKFIRLTVRECEERNWMSSS